MGNYFNILSQFNIIVEVVMLNLSVVMLGLIYMSQPNTSKQMRLCIGGFGLSVIAILSHTALANRVANPPSFTIFKGYALYIIFGISYMAILSLLFLYMDMLAYNRRSQIKYTFYMLAVFNIIWGAIIFYPLFAHKLFVIGESKIVLSDWAASYVYCGLLDIFLIVLSTFVNKKNLAKVAFMGTLVVAPLEVLLLICQLLMPTLIISSCSYVLPFLLIFILFHSNTYDSIIGCQSDESLASIVTKVSRHNMKYVIVYVRFPQLQQHEFNDTLNKIGLYESARACRIIENLHPRLRLYSRNIYTYMAFAVVKNDDAANELVEKITNVLNNPISHKGDTYEPSYKMIIARNNPLISSGKDIMPLFGFMEKQFEENNVPEILQVTDKDLDKFQLQQKVQRALMEIQTTRDLDDPRILVYAQPIFDIEAGTYRTAEALMRMKIDDQMIFPDTFIPVAEANNCIHTLTLVILNKVCKQIKLLEKEYDFDAITINCSTPELSKKSFKREILGIIDSNNVTHNRIRLELTESLDMDGHKRILDNMSGLVSEGVDFYLDDYGTGYSNMERLMSYPFHTIKFDKSILYRGLENAKASHLISILVQFFTDNGAHTLVEGVEDEDQSKYAMSKGFEYIQGYHYARPVPIENLAEYFNKI